jgi:PAS domain S-box-containing protein
MYRGSGDLLLVVDFMPHGFCMRWQADVLWLHVISDALIFLAYASIPFLLLAVARRSRKDIPFHWMLPAFAIFIFACGATHLISIVTIWNPLYRLEGILKLCTAIASVVTAIGLYRVLPAILQMPSHVELQKANEALARSHEELEKLTSELEESNRALQASSDAHRRSETEFRQLADSMPHIVWTAKPDGFITYFNERWYSFTGFDRQIFGDQSWMPLLHPEDAQRRRRAWYAAVRSGLPFREEYRYWDRSSGKYRWHLGRALPITNEQGTIVKWFGGCTDIDDYKRAEADILDLNSELESRVFERTQELTRTNEELKRTQTWLQALLHSATDISIMALDKNGVISFFNSGSERLLGYRADELVGKTTPHLFYPSDQTELRQHLQSTQQDRPPADDEIFGEEPPADSLILESAYLHRDQTRIDVSLAVSPMFADNGEWLGRLLIAVDMRPRKALEQQLTLNNARLQEQTQKAEEANRAKTDFLSAISHEIRTPMNAILGMADLLWESELNDLQRRYVEVFRRACSNLLSLVNDILDLSKIESGRFELEQIDFDLNNIIEMTLEMMRPKIRAKHLTLTSNIASSTPTALVGDPLRLQQILANLLGNAVKFTDIGAISLTVRSQSSEPYRLCFEVTDTGIGIPADKVEGIFQDFTQAEISTSRRFGGTGLGLGICRRLVERMGGQLNVRSTPGEGSTFYFDAVFAPSSPEDRHRSELMSGLAGRRVLIVDDNQTNRLIFAEMCRAWGMEAVECENATEVLALLSEADKKRLPFHLVMLDRLITGSDGIEMVSVIRQKHPHLPILMTTSDQVPGDQKRILGFGAAGYAVKPVRRPELLRLICTLLGSAEGAPPLDTGLTKTSKVIRILIAEDSEDNRFLLQEYLKNGQFRIKFAENGKQALDLATAESFDIILMDMLMPVMDGLLATRLIREMEKKAGKTPMPLLALTASARAEDIAQSRAAGCDAHLSKPISRQELLDTLKKYTKQETGGEQAPFLPISIPPGLEEAAKHYIRSRKRELQQFVDLIDKGDFGQIRRLAHNMKGTGTSYGFPDLTRLGKVMETSAKEENAADLSATLIELSRYVQEAEAQLQPSASGTPSEPRR